MSWIERTISPWLIVLIIGQLGAAVLFGWLAVSQGDWVAGLFAAIAATGAIWHASILLRVRRARSRGARVLHRHSSGGDLGPVLVRKATQNRGARSREGWVILVANAAAFIPTTPWRHLAWRLVGTLLTLRLPLVEIDVVRLPQTPEELAALVHAHGGLWLDDGWHWDGSGTSLLRRGAPEILTTKLPAEHAARWHRVADDPVARRQATRRIVLGSLAVAATLAVLGVVGWWVTGNPDFIVSGLFFAGIVVLGVAGGIWAVSRRAPPARPS